MDLPDTYNGALGGDTPDFAINWYQWRTSTEVVKPTGEYSTEAYVGSRDHLGVEFTPINTPAGSQESAPGPFLVTFLDCRGDLTIRNSSSFDEKV